MAEGPQLAVRGQALERLPFEQGVVARDPVQHRRLQDEEAAVHPAAVALRLLLEGPDGRRGELLDGLAVVDLHRAEASQRLDRGDRRQPAVRPVEGEQRPDVHVGDAVAVGQHEVSSRTYSPIRLMRPPVWVSGPVSTSVTRHGSAAFWWTTIELSRMSKVTSDMWRK